MSNDFPKTFFLGMGAGKSGSTWIYDYLISHPEVSPGPLKEMRVLARPEYTNQLYAFLNLPWHKFEGKWWLRENLQRLSYRSDWKKYFSVYTDILKGDAMATGENSPGNMKLSSSVLRRVKDEFSDRNIRVVPIFVMRDPVDMLRSTVSYRIKRDSESSYSKPLFSDQESALRSNFSEEILSRFEYGKALRNILSIFDSSDVFLTFYERLFADTEIQRLCSTLSLRYFPADFASKVNDSGRKVDLSDQHLFALSSKFQHIYSEVADVFGSKYLAEIWPLSRQFLDV